MGDGIVEANNTSSFISQSGLIEASKLYRLTFEARLKSGTNGTINAYIGGSNNKQFTIANTDWQSFTYEIQGVVQMLILFILTITEQN